MYDIIVFETVFVRQQRKAGVLKNLHSGERF